MGEIVSLQFAASKAGHGDMAEAGARERLAAVRERRTAWGQAMRRRRVEHGFTTRRLAETIGVTTPTLISAVEAGRGRVPQGALAGWATALGMDPSHFAAGYLAAYEPDAFAALRSLLPDDQSGRDGAAVEASEDRGPA
ncbi:helix-turn-helix domain-containing protein [Niveispirillum fermenti]|uniref:helix-turn-helix domain-containing protein n=1 Tax=Niveispirillum fermenti TaxID=1233113 RepID=UPI003A88AE43